MTDEEILEAIKLDLRIDGEDFDAIITRKRRVAEEYLKNAGCAQDYENPLYLELVTRIVGRELDQPEVETAHQTGLSLIGFVEQLRTAQKQTREA